MKKYAVKKLFILLHCKFYKNNKLSKHLLIQLTTYQVFKVSICAHRFSHYYMIKYFYLIA